MRQRLPPVTGDTIPPIAKRPRCATCGTPLRPYISPSYDGLQIVARVFESGTYHGYPSIRRPIFCTSRCATQFATHAYDAGYRIRRSK